MSKRLRTSFNDFVSESLVVDDNLTSIIESLPLNPISPLFYFIINDIRDSYPDNSKINFISLNDTFNMMKYPSTKNRDLSDWQKNFKVTTQIEMRIGRCVKSIIAEVDRKKISFEYIGSAVFKDKMVSFSFKNNGKEFYDLYDNNAMIINTNQGESNLGLGTYVKIFKDDKQIIGSNIVEYRDETYRSYWNDNSDIPYFTFQLDDNIELDGSQDVRIHFECQFDGKYIDDINDSDIEKFVNVILAFIKMNRASDDSKIEEVKGEEIRKWYNSSNYQSKTGQLGGSCMSYSHCQTYLDIYTMNPENISLLVLKNTEGKLIGRALLWKLDNKVSDCTYFMDRVYCHTDYDVKIFEKYATDNNFMYRNSGGNNNITYFINGVSINQPTKLPSMKPELFVTLINCDFDNYPYLDTICFLDRQSSILSNVNQHDMELRDTEGRWTEFYDDDDDN